MMLEILLQPDLSAKMNGEFWKVCTPLKRETILWSTNWLKTDF